MRVMATGLRFPEGPIAMSDGSVLVVEIEGQVLSRIAPDGKVETVAEVPGGPNGAAIGPDGRVYVCNNGGLKWLRDGDTSRPVGTAEDYRGGSIDVVDLATGNVERLYDRCGPNPLKGPNDIVFAADGSFWFTDLGKRRDRDMDRGAVYWARADGSEIREVVRHMFMPNGIGLSPAGDTLYVAETHSARLWSWEILGPGELRQLPWPRPYGATLVSGPGGYLQFDSLAVTASGRICIAMPEICGIMEIAPDGRPPRTHPVPDLFPTNICFGGADMRTAYATLSHRGLLVEMPWHEAGLRLNFQR